jgi:lysophospholipase L1-like esterase
MLFRYYPLIFLILIPFSLCAQARQDRPYWKEIMAFKKSDSVKFPAPNQILFVGSSSFRLWKDLQKSFPEYPIINRGFGGSTLKDVNAYYDYIIKPYHARQIVVYCGDNDFAYDNTLIVDSVVMRFDNLMSKIRHSDKNVMITFISIKPSPSRRNLEQKIIEANARIKQALTKYNNTFYVDVYSKMIDKKGRPLGRIFLQDSLHMNAQGYAIWQAQIKPCLLKK